MKKSQVTMQTKEQELLECAKAEERMRANDFLLEGQPLLEEYFVGEITRAGNGITYRMPNGQVFRLTAGEVC